MKRMHRVTWAVCMFSFASTVLLLDYTMRARPEQASQQELYAVVQRHLSACRSADFPQVYHSAPSSVQEHFSLVQFERKLRRDYQPVAGTHHVEYGAVHRSGGDAKKATVDVYFISHQGEAVGWNYVLVFEDGDWKVDHGAPIPGWPAGQRLSGLKI